MRGLLGYFLFGAAIALLAAVLYRGLTREKCIYEVVGSSGVVVWKGLDWCNGSYAWFGFFYRCVEGDCKL